MIPVLPQPIHDGTKWRHDKVRIGYVSADFHEHATAYLMVELFERMTENAFEVFGISFGARRR